MLKITASLLAADFTCLGEEARRAEKAGADFLHFDIMDGYYVENMALSPYEVRALRAVSGLPFDLHFEVRDPLQVIRSFKGLKPAQMNVMYDSISDFDAVFDLIRSEGAQVGLSINPADPVEVIRPLLSKIDMLMVMAVRPGFGNQKHSPETPVRVAQVRRIMEEEKRVVSIGSDGGISLDNVGALLQAGADFLVIGTTLYRAQDMGATIRQIHKMAGRG